MSTQATTPPQVGMFVRAPKTAELIATHLRRQIVRGELKAGDTLPSEQQLLTQFGVSRPTLREAFRILEAETLINVRRGVRGGAQVTVPDPAVAARTVGLLLQMQGTTINDVYQARMVSEPPCARLLAENRTQQDLDDLNAVVDQLKAEIAARKPGTPEPTAWANLTGRFHQLILQRCGNKTMALQGALLQDIVTMHLHTRVSRSTQEYDTPERFQRMIRAYRKLIKLVEAGDGPGAEKHWHTHMDAAAQYLLKDDLSNKPVIDLFD
ncbi:FadR/GntR family transcriptional regulator [Cryptosporangium sp. NPDC048952]|uniref:FadR/GntR family transcriptional regulator n=1 Tax=Cryptosporangium sp. NPDC048952 TaxID=3363961 RepID=UPI00371E7DED